MVDFLKSQYGYVVDLVVGHSRGSIVAFRWMATSEDGKGVSAFVNVSGRYRMEVCPVFFSTVKIWLNKVSHPSSFAVRPRALILRACHLTWEARESPRETVAGKLPKTGLSCLGCDRG